MVLMLIRMMLRSCIVFVLCRMEFRLMMRRRRMVVVCVIQFPFFLFLYIWKVENYSMTSHRFSLHYQSVSMEKSESLEVEVLS